MLWPCVHFMDWAQYKLINYYYYYCYLSCYISKSGILFMYEQGKDVFFFWRKNLKFVGKPRGTLKEGIKTSVQCMYQPDLANIFVQPLSLGLSNFTQRSVWENVSKSWTSSYTQGDLAVSATPLISLTRCMYGARHHHTAFFKGLWYGIEFWDRMFTPIITSLSKQMKFLNFSHKGWLWFLLFYHSQHTKVFFFHYFSHNLILSFKAFGKKRAASEIWIAFILLNHRNGNSVWRQVDLDK